LRLLHGLTRHEQNGWQTVTSSSKTALWLFIGKDLMLSLISRNIPKSLWGQTALMLIVLAIVLAILRIFTPQHYFMGAVMVCYGFVIGWFAGWLAKAGKAKAGESVADPMAVAI
jgi:NhaP-type Na+/H+ or K+/H+ antiporter